LVTPVRAGPAEESGEWIVSDTRVGALPPAFVPVPGQASATASPSAGLLHGQAVRVVPTDAAPLPDAGLAGPEPPRLVPGEVRVVAPAGEQAQLVREQAAGQFESLQAVTEQMPAQLRELLVQRQGLGEHPAQAAGPRAEAAATQGAQRQAALVAQERGQGPEGSAAAFALGQRPETVRQHEASDLPAGRQREVDRDGRGGGGQGQDEDGDAQAQGSEGEGEGEGEGQAGAQDHKVHGPKEDE
jgi:hypothetical protein